MKAINPEDVVRTISDAPIITRHIDLLKYDPKNIRLAHLSTNDENTFERHLLKIGTVSKLERDIIFDRVVSEPLIILKNDVVIEGNRRLCACRQIVKKIIEGKYVNLNKNDFEYLKCKVIPDNLPPEGVSLYLLTAHLRMKKAWQLFNRAKYIHDLHIEHKWSKNKLSERLGISKPTVYKMIKAHDLTMKYKQHYGLSDNVWYKKYSYFWQLLTTKGLEEIVQNNKKILEYMEWIFFNKFKAYQEVRKLPYIMKNKRAFEVFKDTVGDDVDHGKSFRYAIQILDDVNPELADPLFKKIEKMSNLFEKMPHTQINKINLDSNKMRMIERLRDTLNSAFKTKQNKLDR